MRASGIALLIASFVFSSHVFAEATTTEKLSKDLLGSWLVSVAYEGRTRLLKITEVSQGSGETFSLTAVYGWSDGNQTRVKAEVTQTAKERKLSIITQADSNILVSQDSDTSYIGTFTLRNGSAKGVRISRLSETQMQTLEADASKFDIEKPAADVPASCAAFSGRWTGTWSASWGNGDTDWLSTVAVDAKCVARFSLLSHPRRPTRFKTAEIRDGALAFPCANGTCTFTVHGDDIWGNYFGSDGSYNVVMKRIQ